jgi:hypothetical protein
MTYQTILKDFNNYGKVYFDKQDFIFQGLDFYSDIIIRGKLKKKLFNIPTLITFDKKEETKETDNVKEIIERIDDLTYVDSITSFNLDTYYVKKIKASIRQNQSTHMRFYTLNKDVRLTLFDFRSFISQTQLLRQKSINLFSLPSVQYVEETFTRTLRTDSFLKIPPSDLEFQITKNHIVIINDNKNELSFLLTNQGLKEPIFNFHCDKINKSVSFLYTKGIAIRNTQTNI